MLCLIYFLNSAPERIALFELEEYESAKRALASGREASAGAPLFPQFDRWTKKVDSAIKGMNVAYYS